ncbi:hypothetical protein Tco_0099392 [Tanacetum coccineum]
MKTWRMIKKVYPRERLEPRAWGTLCVHAEVLSTLILENLRSVVRARIPHVRNILSLPWFRNDLYHDVMKLKLVAKMKADIAKYVCKCLNQCGGGSMDRHQKAIRTVSTTSWGYGDAQVKFGDNVAVLSGILGSFASRFVEGPVEIMEQRINIVWKRSGSPFVMDKLEVNTGRLKKLVMLAEVSTASRVSTPSRTAFLSHHLSFGHCVSVFEFCLHSHELTSVDLITMADANINAPKVPIAAASPPTRSDKQILHRNKWVLVGKSNCFLDVERTQANPIFKIVVDILKNTNFFNAFTASSTIPSIYIQQFWDTIRFDKDKGYSSQLDEQRFYLTKATLRDALQLPQDNNNFTSPPNANTIISFVNELGYPNVVRTLSAIVKNDMYTPNSTLMLEIMSRRFFLRLNLPDHRSVLTDSKVLIKMEMASTCSSRIKFIATCSYSRLNDFTTSRKNDLKLPQL